MNDKQRYDDRWTNEMMLSQQIILMLLREESFLHNVEFNQFDEDLDGPKKVILRFQHRKLSDEKRIELLEEAILMMERAGKILEQCRKRHEAALYDQSMNGLIDE